MSKVETQFLKTDLHISKFGAKLAIKDGLFELSWFDENKNLQKETYSPLKVKSLWVQDGAVISVAAHLVALELGIDLVLMDHHGMPQGRFHGFELHTTPAIQKAQVIISVGNHAVAFVKNWIARKMYNQATWLVSILISVLCTATDIGIKVWCSTLSSLIGYG